MRQCLIDRGVVDGSIDEVYKYSRVFWNRESLNLTRELKRLNALRAPGATAVLSSNSILENFYYEAFLYLSSPNKELARFIDSENALDRNSPTLVADLIRQGEADPIIVVTFKALKV